MDMTNAVQPGKELHETNQYQDAAFPVGMYAVTRERIIPHGRGYLDLHWHEELQLTLVTDGRMSIQVNGESYTLEEGQAIFINRNILHITTELTKDGRYVSFNFPDKILGFFPGSRMEQDDVLPFTGSCAFPAAVFRGGTEWQQEILSRLRKMQELFASERILGERISEAGISEAGILGTGIPGTGILEGTAQKGNSLEKEPSFPPKKRIEYLISMEITRIWYQMITHLEEELRIPSKSAVRKQERTRCMLTFIHENYMNPIRLRDIAAAASVSQGECCRCFQEVVRESPGQYLIGYRLSRAMEWLNGTEWSITEIALNAGFNDSSHFIQSFKKKNGMTPMEYRKKK